MIPLTFHKFINDKWKAACYKRCKPSTQQRVDSILRTQLIPTFGTSHLDRISRKSVHKWFDDYSRKSPIGANRTLDVLRQIFNFAIKCKHVTINPTRDIRRNRSQHPMRFLTRTEIDRLHFALDTHQGRGSGNQQAEIIRLLLLTGCRKGEIIGLRWSEINGNFLNLSDSKTGPRRVVLNTQASAVLARQPQTKSPFVFPLLTNLSQKRSNELSLWRKVRIKAEISDVRLHDLRHTFASHAVMQSVPLPVVSRLLGHSQIRMTLRYAHVSNRDTETAAERIGCAISSLLSEEPITSHQQSKLVDYSENLSISNNNSEKSLPKSSNINLTANRVTNSLLPEKEFVNSLELRQSLGKVLDQMKHNGKPIIIYRRRNPAAVLVSLKDYRERFADRKFKDQL